MRPQAQPELNRLVLKPANGFATGGSYDDTDIRNTKRPTSRGRLVPGLVALVLHSFGNQYVRLSAVRMRVRAVE